MKYSLTLFQPAAECRLTGAQNLIFCDIFVDGVAQALGPGLWRKGETALPHGLNPLHQLLGKIVDA